MLRFTARAWFALVVLVAGAATVRAAALPPAGSQAAAPATATKAASTAAGPGIVLPAGTEVALVITRPVQAKGVKPQDAIYAQTTFPVIASSGMAIPPGTYVEGTIVSVTKPTRRVGRAVLRIQFTEIIFANGYTVSLPGAGAAAAQNTQDTMDVTVQASTANDLLLDNGAQMEMTLQSALRLSARRIAAAIPLSRAVLPGQLLSATMCRPTEGYPGTPGTPGTPDTVIPGTPDTVIPGANGMPDTVIPGIPASTIPGTPGTPGTPDMPGTSCPAAPLVISSVPVNAGAQASASSTK